jgi:hydrogenase maturation protein HypF
MAAGILSREADVADWLMSQRGLFPHGKVEVDTILRQLEKKDFIYTSSCGRILDAAAALLGICHERTYEGEPAMKLESAAIGGKYVLELQQKIRDNVLLTTPLITEIFARRSKNKIQDLAMSTHRYLAEGLAELAIQCAGQNGIRSIGFTGGVACNSHLVAMLHEVVRTRGYRFFLHKEVPPGDEGIALGQALVAAESLE